MRISLLLLRMCAFPMPRGCSTHTAAPSFVDPGDTQNPLKNRMEKWVSQRGSQRPLWGPMGSPRAPKGRQMGAKKLPKDVQKVSKMRFWWKTAKCKENMLFTILQPHRPPSKMVIFDHCSGPKITSKPRGNQMDQKWCQNAPHGPPERVQSRRMTPTGSQK